MSTDDSLRLVVLADLHGDAALLSLAPRRLPACDLLILAGDLTHFGGREAMAELLAMARACCPDVLAVGGNCDRRSAHELLREADVDLHAAPRTRRGLTFIGLAGARPGPRDTPYTLSSVQQERALERAMEMVDPAAPLILVSHEPPLGTRADRSHDGVHVGSDVVRRFIERRQPRLCLCGHIHESPADELLGATRIINSGAAKQGRYAYLALGPQGEVREHHLRQASAQAR